MVALWRPEPFFPQYIYRDPVYAPGENRLVGPTDTGDDEARRRSSARRDRLRVRMPFTPVQKDYFWTWWRRDLAEGVNEFWFPGQGTHNAPLGLGSESAAFGDENGAVITVPDWWLVRFDRRVEPPSFELRGRDFDGTFQLTRLL